jgi:hypothetical protein
MPDFAILRTAKLKDSRSLSGSAEHTFRERDTPNADPRRTPQNVILVGPSTAAGIVDAVESRAGQATERDAKAVPCIEYLITASPKAGAVAGADQGEAYLRDALAWLQKRHGAENVVSAVIHLDETTPHLAAYVVPLVETPGKTRKRSVLAGGKDPAGKPLRKTIEVQEAPQLRLSASHYLGNRDKLSAMQTQFAEEVGKPHGLERGIKGSRAKHQRVQRFYGSLDDTEAELQAQQAEAQRVAQMAQREAAERVEKMQEAAQRAVKLTQQQAAQKVEAVQAAAAQRIEAAEAKPAQWRAWASATLRDLGDALGTPTPISSARAVVGAALKKLGEGVEWPWRRYTVDDLPAERPGEQCPARLTCFEDHETGEYVAGEGVYAERADAEAAGEYWVQGGDAPRPLLCP